MFVSLPLRLTEETGCLLSYRTSYTQLHGQARLVEHLIRNSTISLGHDLESLVVGRLLDLSVHYVFAHRPYASPVSGVIERAKATFSKTPPVSSSSPTSPTSPTSPSKPKGTPPTVARDTFFHPYPSDDRGFMRRPWGYLSADTADTSADDIRTSNDLLTTPSDAYFANKFHLTLGDFTAHTE